MAKRKNLPSNSVTRVVEAMQSALAGDIEPPDYVTVAPEDRPFWVSVVRARARSEWTEADLVHAANLARCMADIERETAQLRAEGSVIENHRGTQIANPRHSVIEQLSRRAMALTRILQMQGLSRGEREDKVKARKAERDARSAAESLEAELIPMG